MNPQDYWGLVRAGVADLPSQVPEAWAFGAGPVQADELLDLVLTGVKTGTSSSWWAYEVEGEPLPKPGDLSIVLDGRAEPRAVIRTHDVRVVPFLAVDAEHAHAEGEGDRSLAHWRAVHEQFWREHPADARGFDEQMPVVCERFALVHARQPPPS